MWPLPWKLWIDEDGKPTQRETDVLLGGQADVIPIERAQELGLINADGTPHEPRRGKPKEESGDGE